MKTGHMVHMANQIAAYFASYPREEAVTGIADHLQKFWERRMLQQIFDYVDAGGAGLDELAVEAVSRLKAAASSSQVA
jgi:formate dehydrogenase subunit delta